MYFTFRLYYFPPVVTDACELPRADCGEESRAEIHVLRGAGGGPVHVQFEVNGEADIKQLGHQAGR